MKFSSKLIGDIRKDIAQEFVRVEKAAQSGIKNATNSLKQELRQQVVGAGMGTKLANTWRSKVYPEREKSAQAAGFIWSKAPGIVKGFDKGDVLSSKMGRFLVIPTKNVPLGSRNRRLTPKNWPARLGKLKFVPLKNGKAMLVAERIGARHGRKTASGGFDRARGLEVTRRGFFARDVVMFILVPFVKLPKRLDVQGATEKWVEATPALIKNARANLK